MYLADHRQKVRSRAPTRRIEAEPTTMPAIARSDRIGGLEGGSMVGVAGDTDVVLGWGGKNNLEKAPEMYM